MPEEYTRLQGTGLGVLAGGAYDVAVSGIFLYKPVNNMVPKIGMSREDLEACIPLGLTIPYRGVRQVFVNDSSVWKNRDCFNLPELGIDPDNQAYWGRGNVTVELRGDVENLEEVVQKILQTGIGLRRF